MKINLRKFMAFAILLFVIFGCSNLRRVTEIVDKTKTPKVVTSTDNKIRMTVPASWTDKPNLNNLANLQVAQPLNELYTIVIPDPKINFDETANLDFITRLVKKNVEGMLVDPIISESVPVKIGGYPGMRFEASGIMDKIKIKYIFTVVDTPDTFYQIMSWTLTSMFERNKPKLLKVVETFEIVENKKRKIKTRSKRKTKHKSAN